MYKPDHFAESRPEVLHDLIRRYSLATLVTTCRAGLCADHVPILLDIDSDTSTRIIGHVSRANPVWREAHPEALAIFTGPEHYITPSWYPSKQEHGRVVPTWNYAVVHAHGRLSFFEDAQRLRDIVTRLTRTHEAGREHPWSIDDAPAAYIEGLLKAIVGFELVVDRLEGKWKVSQNRSYADRVGVVEGLNSLETATARESAALVADAQKDPSAPAD